MGEAKRKRSRDAAPHEIFPGKHGPIQSNAADVMRAAMSALREAFPDFEMTLFLIEKDRPDLGRLPRFNYASTVHRDDMVAVLKAFLSRQDEQAAIDAAMQKDAGGHA